MNLRPEQTEGTDDMAEYAERVYAPYGYCPQCMERGVSRERRPFGNDVCANGHVYPSRDSRPVPQPG